MELFSQTIFNPNEGASNERSESTEQEKTETCSVFINDFIDEYGSLSAKHYTDYQPSFRRCSSPGTYYSNRYFKCSKINEITSFNDAHSSKVSLNKSTDFLSKMKRRFSWSKTNRSDYAYIEKQNRRTTIPECSVASNFDIDLNDGAIELKVMGEKINMEGDEEKENEEECGNSDESEYDDVQINIEAAYPMMSGIRTRRGAVTSKDTTSDYRLYNIIQKDGVKVGYND